MVKKKDEEKTTVEEEAKSFDFVPDVEEKNVEEEKTSLLQTQYVRLQADFENFKKRNSASATKRYNEGIEEVIKEVLPTIDYLDMAIIAQKDEAQRKGIELVKKTFMDVLSKYNVKEIEVLGKEFDPMVANAMMNKDDPDNAGKVVEVLKKGYQRNDIILRHAMVVVGQ